MNQPTPPPGDVEVELHFLPTESGGRKGPAFSGYRPQFYYRNHDWDAQHTYIDRAEVRPGETVRAYLDFLSPELHDGHISEGMPFLIREGHRTVAYGRVLRVLELHNSAVRKRAGGADDGTGPTN